VYINIYVIVFTPLLTLTEQRRPTATTAPHQTTTTTKQQQQQPSTKTTITYDNNNNDDDTVPDTRQPPPTSRQASVLAKSLGLTWVLPTVIYMIQGIHPSENMLGKHLLPNMYLVFQLSRLV
jgi:hypothetical protein